MDMTDDEKILRADARKVGYYIRVEDTEVRAREVPYRGASGNYGKCDIVTYRQPGSDRPSGVPGQPSHTARIENATVGLPVNVDGTAIGNIIAHESGGGVLSIKGGEQGAPVEDSNVWKQLWRYVFYISEGGQADRTNRQQWEAKSQAQRLAIIGVGGTGTYLVDLLSRSGVQRIDIWDGDEIEERNARRGPGCRDTWNRSNGRNKAEALATWYNHNNTLVVAHPYNWQEDQPAEILQQCSCIFTAVDETEVRQKIHATASRIGIPVIDVGMGVRLEEGQVTGSLQAAVLPAIQEENGTIEGGEIAGARQQYRNLVLPELHAMNAAIAVTMWRRLINQFRATKKLKLRYDLDWDQWIQE